MSMSTKDYRIIAGALADAKRTLVATGANAIERAAMTLAFDTVVDNVADALKAQHRSGYSFNRELFVQVANGQAPVNARQAR